MATLKQKKAIKKVMENHGNVSKAMIEVGYDPTTAKNPSNLTKSKAWEELVADKIPDDKVIEKINEGMEANRVISAVNTGKLANGATTDFIDVPDYAVRHKYVETALKIKGKLQGDGPNINTQGGPIQIIFKREEK